MIFGELEKVQITSRDTKDCPYLYEVPLSRVARHRGAHSPMAQTFG